MLASQPLFAALESPDNHQTALTFFQNDVARNAVSPPSSLTPATNLVRKTRYAV
jgi:hypothetical protein